MRMASWFALGGRQALGALRVLMVWSVFERYAVTDRGVMLGPNAWCYNKGDPTRIRIGNGAVCRGILRCESFGSGQIIIHQDVYLGDDTLISCAKQVEIHRNSLLAHGVQVFDNDSHPLGTSQRLADYEAILRGDRSGDDISATPVSVGPNAWIGMQSIILKGVTIGEGSIVAAGSVVTKDVPPRTLAAGNPAIAIGAVPHGAPASPANRF